MGDTQPTHEWGRYLRRLTKDRNPTIKELAERAGIARQTLSEYIRDGAESVTIGIVRAIARAAGDEFINALLAAGNIPQHDVDQEIRAVLDAEDLTDVQKMHIIELLETDRERDQQLLAELARRDKERRISRATALIEQVRRAA
jgi:transcriptional regulator with XRE-family HTH domain